MKNLQIFIFFQIFILMVIIKAFVRAEAAKKRRINKKLMYLEIFQFKGRFLLFFYQEI